jgi:hypothetical protein
MDRNEAEQLAWKILGEIEETMSGDGVAVKAGDLRNHMKVPAFFEDAEYEALEKTIVRILLGATEVKPALRAVSLDGHDW